MNPKYFQILVMQEGVEGVLVLTAGDSSITGAVGGTEDSLDEGRC